jgi:hypothetical protein
MGFSFQACGPKKGIHLTELTPRWRAEGSHAGSVRIECGTRILRVIHGRDARATGID